MCGIVGYIGDQQAYPIVISGLKRLEYRGYDSAGLCLNNGHLRVFKSMGKVSDLENFIGDQDVQATAGMGHTRWATHGEPSDRNAHPHASADGDLVLIHNGIIENYAALKELLIGKGYTFIGETDTEVLVNFIHYVKEINQYKLEEAIRTALREVVGAFAIVVMSRTESNKMVVAKMGSPLVIGLGSDEYFIASDATPFLNYTKKAIYLEDGEMAVVHRRKGVRVSTIASSKTVEAPIHQLKMDLESIERGGYAHFMLKEIYEQPKAIQDTFRGRLLPDEGVIRMEGLDQIKDQLLKADRILIIACGTSWHSGLVGEYLLEDLARIPVEVEYASEFRYRNPIIRATDVVIAVSQSGETADTLAAVKLAKAAGATIFGICNVVGSSIARETHAGAYTHAGPEIGVASTKAFTAQVTVLTLMALYLGRANGNLSEERYRALCLELAEIPGKIATMLETDGQTIAIAKKIKEYSNALYLGRGYSFPVALEGALKLKEISYIHAEGYPAAEMKHGPIALIDDNMPVIVIAPKNGHYDKIVSNVQEVHARKGYIIAIINTDDTEIRKVAKHVIDILPSSECFSPLLTTIPLQLLSYHVAVLRGCNVDQPRNLAKSVTVE